MTIPEKIKAGKGHAPYAQKPLKYTENINLPVNSNGFTLIEIMVVIILVAIAGSLVLMNVGKSGRMKESRVFAENLMGLCRRARVLSMTGALPVCVMIAPEERVCWTGGDKDDVTQLDPSSRDNSASREELPVKDNLLNIPEDILLEGEGIMINESGISFICFYPDGSSNGGILTVSVEDEFYFSFQVDMLTGVIRSIGEDDD